MTNAIRLALPLLIASPLGDPDAEVWASVKDVAGHVTGGFDLGPPTLEPTLPGHGCGCAIGARAPAALGLGALGLLLALGLLAALARHTRRQ